ncbi:TetR/AcrR family transcriptional regulator [Microbacterium sp. zg.Y1090]|uniref:TetR/AcrR family transcriptional regulator n=1 Tax=Microbacterium TaxID=33882 RepID=UPI00214C0C11|nr:MULTISPECIES: TetR/AcrR family transcriptional regulator [unclassified Microbacterium]MCR2812566.1 TetR/AcrR family transcriptional regulator [Microbacterium sp. zg.Y1084]MCR2817633.1 TetR/AcrR family transcriptional regulator [Microbacterium sp. zg.Y1090]MDL5485724.1 TetR/AcrR family transcriptional regulator [Microbacterium sp. zg-Y1211]WIM28891.1 TetR/AcrR family transcriptional regulator [Microbacterium sp. zg-Y1090]
MPKITAPTVAEHRASQRAALVRAGEALLQEAGLAGVTPGSVSERAGMSRSSFYDYFPSKDDLLVAIAIDAIERWDADIERTLDGVDRGLPELRAFVDATMRMTADGRHAIAGALRDAKLSPSRFEDLMTLHDALMRPLTRVLADLGLSASRSTVALVQGVLGAGVQLVSHGVDPQVAADDVYGLLTRGIITA